MDMLMFLRLITMEGNFDNQTAADRCIAPHLTHFFFLATFFKDIFFFGGGGGVFRSRDSVIWCKCSSLIDVLKSGVYAACHPVDCNSSATSFGTDGTLSHTHSCCHPAVWHRPPSGSSAVSVCWESL